MTTVGWIWPAARFAMVANGENAAVLSLISRGDGTFEDHYAPVSLPSEATASWQPMELNGDGSVDLDL